MRILPYTRSFLGYRLLHEYFSFPRSSFLDLCELERCPGGIGERMEVCIFLNRSPRLEQPVGASTFLLSCTPIVNLFTQIAEPIRVSHAQTEYQIIPDVRRQNVTEVYAVDRVTCTASHLPEPLDIAPFYSFRHTSEDHAQPQVFWYATRRPSQRPGDEGTEVYLSLVDLTFQPNLPTTETLMVQVTCTNRDLPGKLPFGGDRGDFELEGQRPYCGFVV